MFNPSTRKWNELPGGHKQLDAQEQKFLQEYITQEERITKKEKNWRVANLEDPGMAKHLSKLNCSGPSVKRPYKNDMELEISNKEKIKLQRRRDAIKRRIRNLDGLIDQKTRGAATAVAADRLFASFPATHRESYDPDYYVKPGEL